MSCKNTTDADKPFDSSARANAILRSSDMVDFYVLQDLLCLVSPIFDSMLLLNRGEAKEMNDTKNGLPVIPLEEDSATLYGLLQLIYPYPIEPTYIIELYVKIGDAARKYDIDGVTEKLKKLFLTSDGHSAKNPLNAFAVAVHFGWVDVMEDAAKNTLTIPLRYYTRCRELRLMSAVEYHDLLQWRFDCHDAVQKLFDGWRNNAEQDGFNWGSLTEVLSQRVQSTGCPRIKSIMDDTTIVSSVLSNSYQSHRSSASSTYFKAIKNCKFAEAEIDRVVSTVPLKVNETWVIAPVTP
ncbi:hypothetical protein APHAL10511_005236 [Amanita phalloides]|nr:hypothetical protein APHAL10511_005236 [Amanita phalloides]